MKGSCSSINSLPTKREVEPEYMNKRGLIRLVRVISTTGAVLGFAGVTSCKIYAKGLSTCSFVTEKSVHPVITEGFDDMFLPPRTRVYVYVFYIPSIDHLSISRLLRDIAIALHAASSYIMFHFMKVQR